MNSIPHKLLIIASLGLSAAAIIFLCLSVFGYEGEWTVPAALGCVSLSLLFQIIFRQQSK